MDWFTNYGSYMTLAHCMDNDELWIGIICFFSLLVVAGYLFIAHHAWCRYRDTERKSAMASTLMAFIQMFVLCALCGYGFNILRLVWPAYRLLGIMLVPLSISTWWFLWRCKKQRFFEILFSLEG